ncbi:MAG: hypothetical protein EBR30_24840 [Cytophagia bacterium]|nr:hypothetical protein [Cytophagia bacterium]
MAIFFIVLLIVVVVAIVIVSKLIHKQVKTPGYKPFLTVLISLAAALVLLTGSIIRYFEKTYGWLQERFRNRSK